ncbi:MAG: TonB-dependent receptor [Vicinamibacterales bacterium]
MKRLTVLVALLLLVAGIGAATAQSLTGTIAGRVVDEQGGVLPGVTVTLTGRTGAQVTVTDAKGEYRFVGLNPGPYEVKTELSGFTPRTERNLDVGIGRTVTVPFTLRVGGLAETVEVVANASTIDTASTASDNSLSQDLLANMPINLGNFNAATSVMNYAPGINSGSAFGGDASYGNALLIDGVDTRDPEAGSAWVFYNYNIIEEVQVGGVGAPAEYGGFSGAVVNTITKSGGNRFSGLFDYRHTNDGLAGDNVPQKYLDLNKSLGSPSVITKLNDFTVQLGGPFSKDKAFWWFSVQRYAFERDPAGPSKLATEVSPRYNAKLTWNLTPSDTLTGSFQYDNYNVTGRYAWIPSYAADETQTVDQDSPEAVWNLQYRKLFGSSAFLEAKYTGYWGYYYLDPVRSDSARYDGETGAFSGGAGYYYYADRDRNQANISFSTFANAYGQHNFKFGMEIERSGVRSQFGYTNGVYFYDYGGPYLAYGYSYDVRGTNKRESFYAQDQWRAGRLTANLGVRLDHIAGYSPELNKTVYSPDWAFGPRLGATFDVTGTGNSVLRASWGRYYEGAAFNPYNQAVGGWTPFQSYEVLSNGQLELFDETVIGGNWTVASGVKHFSLDEATVGFEQQLRRDLRVAVTGIWRKWDNFVGAVINGSTWTPFTRDLPDPSNPDTTKPFTLYRWANRTESPDAVVTNYTGFQYKDPSGNVLGTADPSRNYKGVMFVLTKTLSNRWQGQFSYVYSKSEGNISNSGIGLGSNGFRNANTALVNSFGRMEQNRPHEFKLMGGYTVPKIEVGLNAYYRAISGANYTPLALVSGSSSVLNWTGSVNINLDARGSQRLETQHLVDLKVEKEFKVDVHRFGVFFDIANLFNNDTITSVQTRVPDRAITYFDEELGKSTSQRVKYKSPISLVSPVQMTFGVRWSF